MWGTLDNMNPYVIREVLKQNKGKKVQVKIFGMRNKTETLRGTLEEVYPQIFIIHTDNNTRSFSFSEIINGEVKLTFI